MIIHIKTEEVKMPHTIKEIDSFGLDGTENGKIEIAVIEEPYGEGSATVASIGVFLDGANSEPDWKVHIPKADIAKVCEALAKAEKTM